MSVFSNLFGYVLNFIYNIIQNYGFSIILFSILLKIALLPISIKQQKTLKKTSKIQGEIKDIQQRYKNEPQRMNQEVMDVYKRENMSPFSGCLSGIVQIILLFAMFYLVRSPLTFMKKVDSVRLENYTNEIRQEVGENGISTTYPEISVIKHVQNKELKDSELYINMDFLGLDLSNVPAEDWKNVSVYIIPVLYVISSVISIKLTTNVKTTNKAKKDIIINGDEKKEEEIDIATQMNKNMSFFMPIMAVSVSLWAPLGLALYWLINNILMIVERLIINKVITAKEDEVNAEEV